MLTPATEVQLPSSHDTVTDNTVPSADQIEPSSVFSTFINRASKAGRGAFWPLADQGVVSLGNVLTIFLVGRWLQKAEFGTFALIIEGLLFLLSLHAGLITYPLTVKGAVADGPALRRLTSAAGPTGGATRFTAQVEMPLWCSPQ